MDSHPGCPPSLQQYGPDATDINPCRPMERWVGRLIALMHLTRQRPLWGGTRQTASEPRKNLLGSSGRIRGRNLLLSRRKWPIIRLAEPCWHPKHLGSRASHQASGSKSAHPAGDACHSCQHFGSKGHSDSRSHRATMVHCPRSHAFFDHPPFPLHDCLQAGIPVALGTDSLVTIKNRRPSTRFIYFTRQKRPPGSFPP